MEGFYAAVARKEGDGALLILRDQRVIDASDEALRRGVTVGMPLTEAKAVLAGDGRYEEWAEETFRLQFQY